MFSSLWDKCWPVVVFVLGEGNVWGIVSAGSCCEPPCGRAVSDRVVVLLTDVAVLPLTSLYNEDASASCGAAALWAADSVEVWVSFTNA